jgi:cytoskeleton protein RodZ
MESIGDKLKEARERNNITLDQVARETHVAKRFLKALEDEEFAVFPGETYSLGFLRSYAEYLGLNADELVARYRNLKIQEQPVPMTELLEPRRRIRTVPLIVIAAVAVLGVGGWFLYRGLSPRTGGETQAAGQEKTPKGATTAEEFVFQDQDVVRTRWFKQGDVIVVSSGQKNWRIEVLAIDENQLTLRIPGGTEVLGLGQERMVDLNGDQNAEIKIVWNDRDVSSKEKRVNLGLYKATGASAVPASPEPAGQTEAPAAAAVSPIRKASFKPVVLPRTTAENRFGVDFVFLNYCLFRYQADNKDREERFFQKGETFSLDAKENMTLWFSNAGAVKARLDGKDVEIGGSGEVAVRRIVWKKDGTVSQLEVSALY